MAEDTPVCQEARGRFLALWAHKPNHAGGARQWRVEVASLLTLAGRWARDTIALAWLPCLPTAPDLVLHLLKQMARAFRSNSMISWKPWLALAMGLTRIDKLDMLSHLCIGLPTWRRILPGFLQTVDAKFKLADKVAEKRAQKDSGGAALGAAATQSPASPTKKARTSDAQPLAASEDAHRREQQTKEIERVLQAPTPHDVLGISSWADAGEVRRAYRRLALVLHPDKCSADRAAVAFRAIRAAYEAMEV